jgi:plastocyanin
MRRVVPSTLWTIPAVVLLFIALTAGWGGDKLWREMHDEQVTVHRVDITVDAATGTFTYSQDPVNAKRGDHIEWNCDQGSWSVHFIDRTPSNQNSQRGPRGGPRRLPIRQNAEFGSYKYFVAVAIGDDVFTDDPEVVIGPD